MAIGFGVLRLSPAEFWSLSPREFAAALRGLYGEGAPALSRATFEELRARYPDRTHPSRRDPHNVDRSSG